MTCVVFFNNKFDAGCVDGIKTIKLLLYVLYTEIIKQSIFCFDVNVLLIG